MYKEKLTQEQKILKVFEEGYKITQIKFNRKKKEQDGIENAYSIGIGNLPARIWGLKQKGYNIVTEIVKVKKTHYAVYGLAQ